MFCSLVCIFLWIVRVCQLFQRIFPVRQSDHDFAVDVLAVHQHVYFPGVRGSEQSVRDPSGGDPGGTAEKKRTGTGQKRLMF